MKILTVGESPNLLTKDGKVHAELLRSLKADGYYVEAIATNHDVQYFLPNEVGDHYFEHGDGNRTRIYPHTGLGGSLPQIIIQSLQRTQSNAIITIGDYADTSFLAYIKTNNPRFFKWIMLLTSGSTLVNERHRERVMQADYIVTTTLALKKAVSELGIVNVEHVPFGPCLKTFYPLNQRKEPFSALCVAKIRQNSNIGAFLDGVAMAGVHGYLHTNRDDNGDYDIPLLIQRLGITEKLTTTQDFVSLREGISTEKMNLLYNSHHVIVDCSLQSGTALSMLEGMATGCIPVGVGFGAVGEVVSKMPEWCRFLVGYELFIGPGQEYHAIVSTKELSAALEKIKQMSTDNPAMFARACSETIKVAEVFSKEIFLHKMNEILLNVLQSEHAIVVDSY